LAQSAQHPMSADAPKLASGAGALNPQLPERRQTIFGQFTGRFYDS
jgi:hypothetical protein